MRTERGFTGIPILNGAVVRPTTYLCVCSRTFPQELGHEDLSAVDHDFLAH